MLRRPNINTLIPDRFRNRIIAIPLYVVALIVFLPIVLPYVLVIHALERTKLKRIVSSKRCPNCMAELTTESVSSADSRWKAYVEEIRLAHPGARFRIVRDLDALCGKCGTLLVIDSRTLELKVRPPLEPIISYKELMERSA